MSSYREKLVDKVIAQIITDIDQEYVEPLKTLIQELLQIEEARKAIERYM